MAEVVWSNRARRSLLEIYIAIGIHNPDAAERFYLRIESLADRLARHPHMGPRRPELGPTVRMLVERPYLILYETNSDSSGDGSIEKVEIVNVFDGRRDPSKAL